MKFTLGIDPGLSGALALYREDSPVVIFDMPTHTITINKKKKRQLDLTQLSNWIDDQESSIGCAVIEDVNAFPGQGVTSVFNFGFAAGAVQGIIAANFIPVVLVRPNVWKKAMGLTADKDAARRMASRIRPGDAHQWARAKDDGRAEALLLAVYGSRLP